MKRLIDADEAIDALWKALYEYEDKTEKQFQESDELDVADWIMHRVFVQNMSDIDRQTIQNLPSAQPEPKTAYWRTHIFDGIMGGRPRAYMCNYCNFISVAQTDYCPNCGADMRGEQNDDNGTD